jgi:predicted TIM-barrel fold metal-dependent hydrolase
VIIDFHTHVFPRVMREDRNLFCEQEATFASLYESPQSRLAGVKELIFQMDTAEIHKSVIFGFPWGAQDHFQRHNDYILESVTKYPERLIGFACFSILSPSAATEAERCLKYGLSGVGELAVYGSGLDGEVVKSLEDIMAVCEQYDAPLLLHVNEPVGHQYPGKTPVTLTQVYQLIKTYPKNKIVLAHWGGGLFFFGLMKKEVKGVLKNVWFDTAASPYLYHPDIYRIAVEIIGNDRILMGSDYPLLKPQRYMDEMTSAGLGSRDRSRICGVNAKELLSPTKDK